MARDRLCHLSGTLPVAPKLPGIVAGAGPSKNASGGLSRLSTQRPFQFLGPPIAWRRLFTRPV